MTSVPDSNKSPLIDWDKIKDHNLNVEDQDAAQAIVDEIFVVLQIGVRSVMQIGSKINDLKRVTGHGTFQAVRKQVIPLKKRTAERYAALAKEFGDVCATVAHLPLSDLEKLAENTALASLKDEVLATARAGGEIDPAHIKKSIKELLPPKTKSPVVPADAAQLDPRAKAALNKVADQLVAYAGDLSDFLDTEEKLLGAIRYVIDTYKEKRRPRE